MKITLITFALSLFLNFLIIKFNYLHDHYSHDADLSLPQKLHLHSVSRIGGIPIYLSLIMSSFFLYFFDGAIYSIHLLYILLLMLPCFAIGVLEDCLKSISIKVRLFFISISASLLFYFYHVHVSSVGIDFLNHYFSFFYVSAFFSVFAITGLVNAYNLIDGLNGLSSMIALITLAALSYVALKVGDPLIWSLSLPMIGAICGFFIWNYPRGLIFLGDSGAYLLGLWVASVSILLVSRNPSVSPWFALLINAYPIFETLFTIWRRLVHQRRSPGSPDAVHFHSLIFRRSSYSNHVNDNPEVKSIANNSKASTCVWLLSASVQIPAIFFWESPTALALIFILFSLIYLKIYNSIVTFRTPKWLRFLLTY